MRYGLRLSGWVLCWKTLFLLLVRSRRNAIPVEYHLFCFDCLPRLVSQTYFSDTQSFETATDNPLVDGETGTVHHGGNFQAMAISLAMDRIRLSLQHIGKLIFSQLTELLNPTMNRGLPPNLAATDPSVNYFAKGMDIAAAAYVSELGWLAAPVGSHVQSAEMHNQAVK